MKPTTEARVEPFTILAVSDGDEGMIPTRSSKGEIRFADPVDHLWENCDFDGLEGFVVFEGAKHYKPDDYDPETSDLWFGAVGGADAWEWVAVGSWRRATVKDLIEAGLCDPDRGADTVISSDLAMTDEMIAHIVQQYDLKYAELSDDPWVDSEGAMSMAEKHQRSCTVVRKTIRHYLRTNQFRHYRDVELFEASLPARTDEPKEHQNWHAFLDEVVRILARSISDVELAAIHREFNAGRSAEHAALHVLGNPERLGA